MKNIPISAMIGLAFTALYFIIALLAPLLAPYGMAEVVGDVWDPSIRGIYHLPADLRWVDIGKAMGISLSLSFLITIFPARRAARMNPVEALRNE